VTRQIVLLASLALASLLAAGYAQMQLSRFAAGHYRHVAPRGALIFVGGAMGFIGAREFADPALATLAFVVGFGVVHIPAACILLLKRLRGEAPS